jgi:hypothetical protein
VKTTTFVTWTADQLDCATEELASIQLAAAFDVFVCRVTSAARRDAADPLAVVRNSTAGGNSRAATRGMLRHLGYSPAQLRVVHRLLGGSPAGWPGLLSLFVKHVDLTPDQRAYARRQLRAILGSAEGQERKGAMAS